VNAPKPGLKIGLTGGIGSGKSTVARLFVERGACLVDTDAIARSLTAAQGAAMPALVAEFGPAIQASDGALAREVMRELAFTDTTARQRLEAILHPLIGAEAQAQAAAARPGQTVVFDVPLLAESRHWRARVDKVLVVDCSEATQVARVAQRPGWDMLMAQRVLGQQASRATRRAVADAVIFNDGGLTLAALAQAVDALGRAWGLWNNPPAG
jgi:dephospho-CoA kinase